MRELFISPSVFLSAAPTKPAASNVEQTENTKTTEERFIDMMLYNYVD